MQIVKCYLLTIMVGDIAHYDRIYQQLIARVPGLSDVSSTFSMERLKYGTALEINLEADWLKGRRSERMAM